MVYIINYESDFWDIYCYTTVAGATTVMIYNMTMLKQCRLRYSYKYKHQVCQYMQTFCPWRH